MMVSVFNCRSNAVKIWQGAFGLYYFIFFLFSNSVLEFENIAFIPIRLRVHHKVQSLALVFFLQKETFHCMFQAVKEDVSTSFLQMWPHKILAVKRCSAT